MEASVSARAARRIFVLAFALTTVYFTGFFPPDNNPNELSRIQAIVAWVDDGTFAIDEPLRRFGDHMDKSVSEIHYYSNKAPGLIFAGIPVYRLLRAFFPPPVRGTDPVFVFVRLLTVSLVSWIALALFLRRVERSPEGDRTAPLVAFALAFGTPLLYYARSFFSHAWTAALLFLSWEAIRAAETRRGARAAALLSAAGLLAGFAAISEYPVALVGALLAWRAFSAGRWRGVSLFAAGAAPAFFLLLAYNSACFGSPFTLSSAREASPPFAELAGKGVFGLGLPNPLTALLLLFHPARGLVLFSPVWIWFVPGIVRWWRSRRERRDCVLVAACVGAVFVSIAAYPNWWGGWSLGARYLVPVFFFAATALPHALHSPRSRGWFLAAAAFSATGFFVLTSAYPHIPLSVFWPTANFSLPLIRSGRVAPNAGQILGISAPASLLIPLVTTAALLAIAALRLGRQTAPRRRLAVLAGVLLATLIVVLSPPVSRLGRDERGIAFGKLSSERKPSSPRPSARPL